MADDNKAKESRSESFTAAQAAFNALTTDEKLSFLMENMLSAAVGGVQKASDIFADAMEEAIRTARKACADDGPAPADRAGGSAPEAGSDGDVGAGSDSDSDSPEQRGEG
ncbi:MAG: hypothetical protein RIE53_03560 [Rhodothermales bacterium]